MQVMVYGNFMRYYDYSTDTLNGADCPIRYSNSKLIYIDEEVAVFEVNECSRIVRVNGVGDVEEVIFE